MTRNNHHKNYSLEPYVILGKRNTTALGEYLRGRTSASDTINNLESGKNNKFLAAEICLQEAAFSKVKDKQEQWLDLAQKGYEYIASDTRDAMYTEKAKSLLQLAQFEAYRKLIVDGKLPDAEVANKIYTDTLHVSHEIVKKHWDIPNNNALLKSDMSGAIAETSILLMIQRFALNAGITDSWFPVFSFVGEDNMNLKERDIANKGWDISLFTHTTELPELSYKLQVKSTNGYGEHYADDISVVSLFPDLKLGPHEFISSSLIAEECYTEGILGAKNYGSRLDIRTEKLLEQIG